jgi:uncharacterized membrane protein HdeD (DUF308 family)
MEPTRVLFGSVFVFGFIDIVLGIVLWLIFPPAAIYLLTGVVAGIILLIIGAIGVIRAPKAPVTA